MLEVQSLIVNLLGLRADLVIAAGFGAVFLVLYRELTPRQAMGAVAGGIGSANYLAVLCVRGLHNWLPWIPQDATTERATALIWGLGGTFVFAGLIVLLERWKKDPIATIREIKP